MSRNDNILRNIDWLTVALFIGLVLFGWLNIYGASYTFEQTSMFDPHNFAGKQLIWIGIALFAGFTIMLIDEKTYDIFAYIFYAIWIVVLILTPLLADNTKGSLSWISIGGQKLQPAEFAKCVTALALAKYMSRYDYDMQKPINALITCCLILLPMFIIMVPQKETGSALVFSAFFLMLYREGMSGYLLLIAAALAYFFVVTIRFSIVEVPIGSGNVGQLVCALSIIAITIYFLYIKFRLKQKTWYLIGEICSVYALSLIINIWYTVNFNIVSMIAAGISICHICIVALQERKKGLWMLLLFSICAILYCYSCNFVFSRILQPHQQQRIEVLLGLKDDPAGAGYNVNQSKIAIGSGRLSGKGFLQGTQTKLKFVPEQHTDFIFCTIGEEWGFIGSATVLIVYLIFILRLIYIAERQKDKFSRIYAYSVSCIFIVHLTINVGMVLGLMPVIGIPLPFFSYGGSSLLGFSILLFILLKLDALRVNKIR
ncbi:MAG: rod shape-determining protein RodA [Paludibacter sp.]|nr:rod shape-determining protein RodA [Bacteroidales bacterium]MCM1068541.1 rod shape-determining protein RodA [Prevotella sp.]MCM1353205.1 rod shape-determining protein RodA [Bacteroides sp.]MCM1442387.1 rod shape-determining protein RodA [Muribaculum sp.]MCM1481206.1 rod shape-determining protein RodA [Paludibacter sp.]